MELHPTIKQESDYLKKYSRILYTNLNGVHDIGCLEHWWVLDFTPDNASSYLFPVNGTIYLGHHRDADHIEPVDSRDDHTTACVVGGI